jgi:MFS family permease
VPPVDGVFAPGRRSLTAGLIGIVTLVATEALAVATVLPLVEEDLGRLDLYGWVFSGFFLGQLVGIVVAGRLADRVRPVVPFVAGVALFGAGLALGALAPTMPVLVAARVLQGLGAGALPACAYVAIGRAYPHELRPRMFALLSTAWVVPSLVGPALAGVVGQVAGWRWVFAGLLPVLGVIGTWSAVAVRAVPAPAQPEVRPGVGDAVVLALGAGVLLAGLGAAERPLIGLALVVAGGAAAVPAFRRLTPTGTLRLAPGMPAAVGVRGVLTCAFFAADAWVPFLLTSLRGLPVVVGGVALTGATLAWTAGAWVQERLVQRTGPRWLVRRGLVGVVAGVGATATALSAAVPAAVGVVGFALAGFGMGLAYAPLSVTVLALARTGREGEATASLQLSDTLGIALGTGVAGALVALADASGASERAGVAAVFGFAAAVAVAGTVAAGRIPVGLAAAQRGRLDQEASVDT